MRLSKPMIEIFAEIARGNSTIGGLANAQHKSVNWITEILQELEKEGFAIKKTNYKIKGSRINNKFTNTNHAIALKDRRYPQP